MHMDPTISIAYETPRSFNTRMMSVEIQFKDASVIKQPANHVASARRPFQL
jgi:hypothetical protein